MEKNNLNYILNNTNKNINLKNKRICKPFYYTYNELHRPFGCNICYKIFTRKYTLDRHYRLHTGQRPYRCLLCYKEFSDLSSFSRHKKIHL